jgi:O-methyltransferase involved in polyketide biosynthesis
MAYTAGLDVQRAKERILMKIQLRDEMETLLIPLYGRAQMSRRGLFYDRQAEEAVRQIDYDFSRLCIQEKTQLMLSVRGAMIDAFASDYLNVNPGCTVVYLGCGLDARFQRMGEPDARWYDLDFPQVIEIKKQLYAETERYMMIPSSVTDWDWLEGIDANDRPVLVIAEGLMMYLSETDVKTLFCKMREAFSKATFIFDAYSCMTAKQAKNHPSLKKTGARIQWGVDGPETHRRKRDRQTAEEIPNDVPPCGQVPCGAGSAPDFCNAAGRRPKITGRRWRRPETIKQFNKTTRILSRLM